MADIRINALATTAASTASDDFIAVDGSANGTRKLNAYSPTFGGNLTVSGTGTSSVAGSLGVGTTSPASLFETSKDSGYQVLLSEYSNNTNRVDLVFRKSRGSAASPATTQVGDYLGIIDFQGRASSSFTVGAEIFSQVEAVGGSVYGNLIFSTNDLGGGGITERIRLFNNGNFGIGTGSTDGGQKLQVSGTSNFSNPGSSTIANFTNSANADFQIVLTASTSAKIGPSTPTSLILQTNGTTALTLDSSQNATFAGTVKIANTAEIKGVYTTTTTFDFGTIANNDASSVCTLTMTGVSSSDSIIVSPTDGDNFPQFCTVSAVPSGNTVAIRLYNGSGSSRTVGSRSIRVTAIKF